MHCGCRPKPFQHNKPGDLIAFQHKEIQASHKSSISLLLVTENVNVIGFHVLQIFFPFILVLYLSSSGFFVNSIGLLRRLCHIVLCSVSKVTAKVVFYGKHHYNSNLKKMKSPFSWESSFVAIVLQLHLEVF